MRFYLRTLAHLLRDPRGFFSGLPEELGMGTPLLFLLLSSLVFTLASLMHAAVGPLTAGAIFLANAVGMVFITSALGYMAIVLAVGRKPLYSRVFAVYAFSAGVTLLTSWMPYFLLISEPWKWWLIYTGLTRSLALTRLQALAVIGFSIAILILFFWTLLPLIAKH